ncbi:MAG: 3-deoxy-D-manno-octulosonic acid transferase [Planctomycetaceae bacterium]
MLAWLLNIVYLLAAIVIAPLMLYRAVARGKYRAGWGEKLLGNLPRRGESGRPCVWFHAVSVGEVLQLQPLLRALREAAPACEFLISTTTATGHSVARDKFPEHRVCYFPLDFSWAVNRALARVNPDVIVLVELELWPNFILSAARREIPLALVNGRISARSFRGYRRVRPLMRRLLTNVRLLAVQTAEYGERLAQLGGPRARIEVTGSIKFDGLEADRDNLRTRALRDAFGLTDRDRVVIAGSTQSPEESIALDAYESLRAEHPELRLMLVPRHKERFEEVARLVEERGHALLRRTETQRSASPSSILDPPSSPPPVLLLDTLGELGAAWGLAEIAFVGGSLTNRGGQNMMEPAAYGAAVLFGPNTHNFRDVVEMLLVGDAARVVRDGDDLRATLRELLATPTIGREQGKRARTLVLAQRGATARTVEAIRGLLPAIADTGSKVARDAA